MKKCGVEEFEEVLKTATECQIVDVNKGVKSLLDYLPIVRNLT